MSSVNKKRKVGIIGVGHVGSHVASMLITRQLCEELILIDNDTPMDAICIQRMEEKYLILLVELQ